MSYNANELLKLASDFDNLATKALVVEAKKKEKKKLDPKAKLPKNKKNSKKKASEYYDTLLSKFADGQVRPEDVESSKVATQQRIQTINSSSSAADVDSVMEQVLNDFRGNQIDGTQYAAISSAAIAKKQSLQQVAPAPTPAATQTKQPSAPARSKYPPIDTAIQTMLGVNPDGSLGPMTQAALEMFKKSVGLPYGATPEARSTDSNKNNQQAIAMLKRMPNYKNRTRLEYDDTNDVYRLPEL